METDQMLEFVKALAHADRLKVLGVLARGSATVSEISAVLGIHPKDVFQHLVMLEHGGIVSRDEEKWLVDGKKVEQLSRSQFEGKPREVYSPVPDINETTRKVLVAYLNADGTIKQLPHEPAKLQIILDYLLQAFTPGVIYTEKEVNMIIRRFHLDTAGLRRDMIDRGMLERKSDGSQYWRPK